jgi:hypothetical protein
MRKKKKTNNNEGTMGMVNTKTFQETEESDQKNKSSLLRGRGWEAWQDALQKRKY